MLIKRKITYSSTIEPLFERHLYAPAVALVIALARRVGVIQKGSIQAYLTYIFVILLVMLVVFR